MNLLLGLFLILAITCEVLFIVGVITTDYHLEKALTGNTFKKHKWYR